MSTDESKQEDSISITSSRMMENGEARREEEAVVDLTKKASSNLSNGCKAKTQTQDGGETTESTTTTTPREDNNAGQEDSQYFYEDHIFYIDKKGKVKFGVVLETCDSYSNDEDDDDAELLSKGLIRVAFYPEGNELVKTESSIGLADRTLMPGDVVKLASRDGNQQRGYVRDLKMTADVKVLGTKYIIKNVSSDRLKPISVWQRDGTVFFDNWVGSIKDFEEKVVLKASNGSIIEISSAEFHHFREFNSHRFSTFAPQIFYPGNIVVGRLPSVDKVKLLTPDIPLLTNRKGRMMLTTFVVQSLRPESVDIRWQCRTFRKENANVAIGDLQQPKHHLTDENMNRIQRLSLFEPCMLQIGDRNFLVYDSKDALMKKTDWDDEQVARFKPKMDAAALEVEENQNEINKTTSESVNHDEASTIPNVRRLMEGWSDDVEVDKEEYKKKKTSKTKDTCKNHADGGSSSSDEWEDAESSFMLEADEDANDEADYEANDENEANEQDQDNEFSSIKSSLPVDEDSNPIILNNSTGNKKYSMPINICTPYSLPYHHRIKKPNRKLMLKKTKKRICNSLIRPNFQPKQSDLLIIETLLVYSTATVVWQDGTVEANIPSTELYPIHHLDNHEFFPGDFVMLGREDPSVTFRDYGVIQSVDHAGRTARVKWFTTYVSPEEMEPSSKGETEMSVYDLKDHPDFNFRPGTLVIRVANFVGENENSTVGQVVDNGPDGQVKVWWVDGYMTQNWPQDLFEVGHRDQQEFENEDSDDSWETESENSEADSESYYTDAIQTEITSSIAQIRTILESMESALPRATKSEAAEIMSKLLHLYGVCHKLNHILDGKQFPLEEFVENIPGLEKMDPEKANNTNGMLNMDQSNMPNINITMEMNSVINVKLLNVEEISKLELKVPTEDQPSRPENMDEASRIILVFYWKTKDKPTKLPKNIADNYINFLTVASIAIYDVIDRLSGNLKSDSKSSISQAARNALKENLSENLKTESVSTDTANMSNDSGNCSRVENSPEAAPKSSQEKECNIMDEFVIYKYKVDNAESVKEIVPKFTSLINKYLDKFQESLNEKFKVLLEKFRESDEAGNNSTNKKSISKQIFTVLSDIVGKTNSAPVDSNKSEDITPADDSMENDPAESESKDNCAEVSIEPIDVPAECFLVLPNAPATHKFYKASFEPDSPPAFLRAVQKEQRLLKTSLPPGIWVRTYEDRSDLFSVMMEGPKKTPYEGGLFFFDIQLSREYPRKPPLCHYISYCMDRLNPNLYEDGKVCVSLLGTWTGRDTELWTQKSTLLQVIISIQGLILVPEPYFNEAGYEKQKGSLNGEQNSRMYNEMAIIKMVQATIKMLAKPPEVFYRQIVEHYQRNGHAMYLRVKGWMELSKANLETASESNDTSNLEAPEFPLLPASRGFCLTLESILEPLKAKMEEVKTIILEDDALDDDIAQNQQEQEMAQDHEVKVEVEVDGEERTETNTSSNKTF